MSCHVGKKPLLACILLMGASGVREEAQVDSDEATGTAAGGPTTMNALDLFNVHDLLLVGYYAPMMKGPHLRERTLNDPYHKMMKDAHLPAWSEDESDPSYGGLREARKGAVMLAKIVKEIHPVEACRDQFAKNQANASSDEELIELQAATAWACVGVAPDDVILCGGDGRKCGHSAQKPLTAIRHKDTGKLLAWEEIDEYRNFELKLGDRLGACYQPPGTGGPKMHRDAEGNYLDGAEHVFKKRIHHGSHIQRRTAWLRACSYWSAFHSMALRADALGGQLPNQLFGSIVRIIAGGALFCGG